MQRHDQNVLHMGLLSYYNKPHNISTVDDKWVGQSTDVGQP